MLKALSLSTFMPQFRLRPPEELGRFSINKTIHGDLEATSIGEMFTGRMIRRRGLAGYVFNRDS